MKTKRHHSSVQVMFSDKGSTFMGVFSLLLMLSLSITFFILKFQKNPTSHQSEKTTHKKILTSKALRHSRVLFYPMQSKHALLFHYPRGIPQKNLQKAPLSE